MDFNGTVKISSDEYRDLCERVAIAEERLERLWDYIEQKDRKEVESNGRRTTWMDADDVKLITGYTEKMAAAKYIIEQIEKHEGKEENKDGDSV